MKKLFLAAGGLFILMALAGCGGGGSSAPATIVTQILSDPTADGDIVTDITVPIGSRIYTIAHPGGTVQSLFAGINPAFPTLEYRAFLDFPLGGVGGVPLGATIVSATLDIVVNSIAPNPGTIPIRIELVRFPPPLIDTDFERGNLLPLAFTTISPPITQLDVGLHVPVNVTALMQEAQRSGLSNFQVRILLELGAASGQIEIDDRTGALRNTFAPLLTVEYF